MNTEEIAGGVSPLKKKWKGTASRSGGQKRSIKGKMGGSAGVRNTSTKSGKKRRGGFSKTGAKGSNVHGYGIMTRFKPIVTKDYKGPIAAATTPKTGGGGGGGGGGDTYNTSYGDDNSVDKSQDFSGADLSTNVGTGAITNETNTDVVKKDKIDVDQTNKNTTKQKIKTKEKYTYRQAWADDKDGIKAKYGTYEKYKEAAINWNNSAAGKKYWANKNKTKQSNESEIDASQNLEDVGNIGDSDSGIDNTKGHIGTIINPIKYDTAKRSPNKMKSHAWEMLNKQKKSRGGTQKY